MRLLARVELRLRWRSLLVVALLVAVWTMAVTATIAGARRTASAVDRFREATTASDATFGLSDREDDVGALAASLRAQPAVLDSDTVWYATTGLGGDEAFVQLAVGTGGRWGRTMDRPLVLAGRLAHPDHPEEVVVTESAARLLGVRPGDPLTLTTWDKAEYDAWLVERGPFPPFDGPAVPVTVVGVVRVSAEVQASDESRYLVLATPAFHSAYGSAIGENGSSVVVRFRDRGTDAEAVGRALAGDTPSVVTVGTSAVAWEDQLRDAARVSRIALVVLAVVVGAAGALTVTAVAARDLRSTDRRSAVLPSLGARQAPLALTLALPVAVGGVLGAVAGAAGAVLVSTAFPLLPARLAEPHPGVWVDLPVVGLGALLCFLVTGAVGYAAARLRLGRAKDRAATPSPHPLRFSVGWLSRVLGPAVDVGHRRALAARDHRWTTLALAFSIVLLVATCWFADGLRHLGAEPRRWGYVWSASPELGFPPGEYDAAILSTLADPRVQGSAQLAAGPVGIGDRQTTVAAFFAPPGVHPEQPVLEGRLPVTATEVALGRRTADRLGAGVGDLVTLERQGSRTELTMVGVIVPPALLLTTDLGEGALVTAGAFQRLGIPFDEAVLLSTITYHEGVDAGAVERDLSVDPGWDFGFRSHAQQPPAVANLMRARGLVWWLAAVAAALGLGLAGVLATRGGGTRQRDLAVLHALGFSRTDRRVASASEAATIGIVTLLVGLPLGLVAGAAAWRLVVGGWGIVDDLPPPGWIAAAGLAAVATAVGLAYLVGGRRHPRAPRTAE